MASSDVDQKYLGRIARATQLSNGLVSQSLFQILGISTLLARRLFRARRLRKLDTTRDTRSLQLYHHIIWLSREGLSLLEVCVLPYTLDGSQGPECQVLSAKLRASFMHIFCLFANNPPITQASVPVVPTTTTPTPLSPRQDNGQRRDRSGSSASQADRTPKRNSRGRDPTLREPVASMTSDASFLTNPYAGIPPGTTPPPGMGVPPGLTRIEIPQPSAFLVPAINFVPLTTEHFKVASRLAASVLPGAHPLRLSVAIEHAAFLWDCVHDHEASRQLARRAIRELRHAEDEGVTDEMFEDAAEMVGVLGRIMRRRSWEGTPRSGGRRSSEALTSTAPAADIPPVPAPILEPIAPLPEPPRRPVHMRRDRSAEQLPPDLEGGPVGGSPSARRTSNGTRRHSHRSSGSRSTRDTVIRRPLDDTPPRPPPKNGRAPSDTTPPRPPPKDRPPGSARRPPSSASSTAGASRVSKGKGAASERSSGRRRSSTTAVASSGRRSSAAEPRYGENITPPPAPRAAAERTSAERTPSETRRRRADYRYQEYPAWPAYPAYPAAVDVGGVNGAALDTFGAAYGGDDEQRAR